MDISGKVAIVSGAASGLGRETCVQLAATGAHVAAFDRDAARLDPLVSQLGASARGFVVDVASEDSVRQAVEAVVAAFGAVHVAVNCAGVADAAKTVSRGEPFPLST